MKFFEHSSPYPGLCLVLLSIAVFSGCDVPDIEVPENVVSETAEADSSRQSTEKESSRENRQVKQASEPLEMQRGLALKDWPDGFAYALVKAKAKETAIGVASNSNDRVVEDAFGKSLNQENIRTVVSQFKGHGWSQFAWFDREPEEFIVELSRQLNTTVILVSFSDFAGWQFIDIYRAGENIESLHWGLDYSEELGRGPDLKKWDTHVMVTRNLDGISLTDQILFRSSLRKVSTEELSKGDLFADWLLREHDVLMPEGDVLVWPEENGSVSSSLGEGAFDSVHAVMSK